MDPGKFEGLRPDIPGIRLVFEREEFPGGGGEEGKRVWRVPSRGAEPPPPSLELILVSGMGSISVNDSRKTGGGGDCKIDPRTVPVMGGEGAENPGEEGNGGGGSAEIRVDKMLDTPSIFCRTLPC